MTTPVITFALLGTLEVRHNDHVIPMTGKHQRSLLAALLIHRNNPVPLGDLINELWPDGPPRCTPNALHAQISRLRRTLPCGAETGIDLRAQYPGYLLDVPAQALDTFWFRYWLQRANTTKSRDFDEALSCYRKALDCWRGPPLHDIPPGRIRDSEVERLDRERINALAQMTEIELACGRYLDAIPRLERLIVEHPLEEHLYVQLMIALEHVGRPGDAIRVYQRARQCLAVQLGLSPSAVLDHTMDRILQRG
ncbi:AfsR/SARP family transcriptional regulator [Nocardia panacis]|nr:AfsR/SARP family transcriptional regulator [Nocardia panacis]